MTTSVHWNDDLSNEEDESCSAGRKLSQTMAWTGTMELTGTMVRDGQQCLTMLQRVKLQNRCAKGGHVDPISMSEVLS